MSCKVASGGGGEAGVALERLVLERLVTARVSVSPCPVGGGSQEASALFSEMAVPPSGDRETAYIDFIEGLKSAGLWDDLEIGYIACAENVNDAKLNIKNPSDVLTRSSNAGSGALFTVNRGWKVNSSGFSNYQRVGTGLTIGTLPNFDHNNCTFAVLNTGAGSSTQFMMNEDAAGTFRHMPGAPGVTIDAGSIATSGGTGRSSTRPTTGQGLHAIKRQAGGLEVFSDDGQPFVGIGSVTNSNNTTQFGNSMKLVQGSFVVENERMVAWFYYSIPLSNAQVKDLNALAKLFANKLGVLGFNERAETTALLAAMSVQPSEARKWAINQYIWDIRGGPELVNDQWGHYDFIYWLGAHDEQAARLDWKNPGSFTLSHVGGTLSFTTDRGFTVENGKQLQAARNWSALTQFVRDNCHLQAWSLVTSGGTGVRELADRLGNSNPRISLNVNNTANAAMQLNDQTFSGGGGAGGNWVLAKRTGAAARQIKRVSPGEDPSTATISDAVASTDAPQAFPVQIADGSGVIGSRIVSFAAAGNSSVSITINYTAAYRFMREIGVF